MASSSVQPFRFLDLPSEIRNTIYLLLLCSFDAPPSTTSVNSMHTMVESLQRIEIVGHSIETAILRTCKQVHREAYDLMIKTNRFVRIKSAGGIPLLNVVNSRLIPVVTMDLGCIERFKGYVLALSMFRTGYKPEQPMPEAVGAPSLAPCSFVLLARDMDTFCKAFADSDVFMPGSSTNLVMSITVAPVMTEHQTSHKDLLRDFFSEATQNDLLRPLRANLRGLKNVKIRGTVSRSIATTTEEEMAQDEWTDGRKIVENATAAKERGNSHFRRRDYKEACLIWRDAAIEIKRVHRSSSWKNLVVQGGRTLVADIAEVYFLLQLNAAHAELIGMENNTSPFAGLMAEAALVTARESMNKSFWIQGFKWKPSSVQEAKLWYRTAMYHRLDGLEVDKALTCIKKALELAPGDAGIIREQQKILSLRRG